MLYEIHWNQYDVNMGNTLCMNMGKECFVELCHELNVEYSNFVEVISCTCSGTPI